MSEFFWKCSVLFSVFFSLTLMSCRENEPEPVGIEKAFGFHQASLTWDTPEGKMEVIYDDAVIFYKAYQELSLTMVREKIRQLQGMESPEPITITIGTRVISHGQDPDSWIRPEWAAAQVPCNCKDRRKKVEPGDLL